MKKYHQTEGAFPLLNDPRFYSDIGSLGEGPQVEAVLGDTYVCPDDIYLEIKTLLGHLKLPPMVSGKEPPTLMSLAAYI